MLLTWNIDAIVCSFADIDGRGCRGAASMGRALGLLVVAGWIAGCSVSWTESDGSRRVVGLVSLRITDAGTDSTFAGRVIDQTTIGLAALRIGDDLSISAGYARSVTAGLRDNALVLGNPLAVRARAEVTLDEVP